MGTRFRAEATVNGCSPSVNTRSAAWTVQIPSVSSTRRLHWVWVCAYGVGCNPAETEYGVRPRSELDLLIVAPRLDLPQLGT